MTKRFCDCCMSQIHGCLWWTLGEYADLCDHCYRWLKHEQELAQKKAKE